jgi:hypothetical protein
MTAQPSRSPKRFSSRCLSASSCIHRQVGIGIGDLDTCADSLTFVFEEASLRKASLVAVHAWHAPRTANSRT